MKTHAKIAIATPAVLGAMALSLAVTSPAAAQSRYDRDRSSDRTEDALIGAAVGALAGAVIGNGDGAYIAGGALAGAAVGASSSSRDDCGYYRGGRCYRNLGHWEREHGINSRDGYYGDRYDNGRYVEGRTYRGRGYYRDGRFWRNHGQWRSAQNHDRDYRYDRRW
ncbi:YMGG-like glycine zipper-containing protein [Brevundimonas sp.]|uniref:YMGG-like glycine zipper-containing protein n=1 Tax=Brevundimonas sp. TaxID=1871086 RepID=UPI0035B4F1D5